MERWARLALCPRAESSEGGDSIGRERSGNVSYICQIFSEIE